MKINFANVVRNSVGVLGLILTASFGCAFAQGENRGGGRLEGTWDTVVTITNCATGSPITSFNSIGTFMRGGTSIGSTAGMPQARRTPEHGVWRHEAGQTYSFRFKTFSFDAAGNPAGWSIVSHQLELAQDANNYTSAGTAQHFAPNGAQVGQGCSSAVGTRFEL